MVSNKIEQLYFGWIAFISITVFLLSIFGIWFGFNHSTVICSLLISITASYLLSNLMLLKNSNSLALIALAIFLVQSSSTVLVSFIPTFSYDEVAYSVSLPKHYVAAHQFYYVDDYGPYSAFPQNYETLTSASLLFFGSPFLAKFINYILGFGMVLAANRMSIQCGISARLSLLAGAFVGCSLAFVTSLPIAKNDVLNAFFQVWAIVILFAYHKEKRLFFAGMIGVLLGSAIGAKYNSLIFSIVAVGFFVALTHLSSISYRDKFQRYLALFFFLFLAAFPWYLRNYIEFQNPFYPAFNELFIGRNLFNQTYVNVFNEIFYDDIVDFTWASGTIFMFFKKHVYNFGALVSILGFLGLLLSMNGKGARLFLAWVLVALTMLTLKFGFWEPRYNLVLLIITSVFAALFCDKLLKYIKNNYSQFNVNTIVMILICMLCMLGFFRGLKIYKSIEYDFLVNRSQFFEKNVPYWKVANYLNQNTPKNAKIGVGFGANQMFYYLDRPYYHFHPVTEKGDLLNMKTPSDFIGLIRNQHVDYLAISNCCSYGHTQGKTPVLTVFMKNFYEGISSLNDSHLIEKIAVIDDVVIYKTIEAKTQ
jgi:hypothetical protein